MTLRCANGGKWTSKGCGPCKGCRKLSDQLEAEFWRAVFLGDLLPSGHTPAEWDARYADRSISKGYATKT